MEKKILFKTGFVYNKSTCYISAVIDELERKDVRHTAILRWMNGKWDEWMIKKRVVSHGVYDLPDGRTVVSAAIEGVVQVADKNGFRWEVVDSTEEGPNDLRRIRGMRRIGNGIYVIGMSRMVYRRPIDEAIWRSCDEGVRVSRSSKEVAGFSSIGGESEKDIYAVGMRGEIWRFDGETWGKSDSGTNIGLYDIQVENKEKVYVCGDGGILLEGSRSRWRRIHNDATTDCFWSMAFLNQQLFLATDQGSIFTVKNDEVVPVSLSIGHDISTYSLHSADNVLLSVGSRDIVIFDGKKWQELSFSR